MAAGMSRRYHTYAAPASAGNADIEIIKVEPGTNDFSSGHGHTWKEDLLLVLEGRRLPVSSVLLSLSSPVWSGMIVDLFSTPGTTPRLLPLDDVRYDEISEFIKCINPGVMKTIDKDNVMVVLPLAEKYRAKQMKKRCEEHLVSVVNEDPSAKNVCKLIGCADKYKLDTLYDKCEPIALKYGLKKLEKDGYAKLPLDVKVKLQDKEMSKMDSSIRSLKKRLKDSKRNYSELELAAKTIWVGEELKEFMPDAEIGILKFNLECDDGLKGLKRYNTSDSLLINDLSFFIEVTCDALIPDDVKFGVRVSSDNHDRHSWTCKTKIRFTIISRTPAIVNLCSTASVYFTESKLSTTVMKVPKSKFTPLGGYWWWPLKEMHVEAYLLVDRVWTKKIRVV